MSVYTSKADILRLLSDIEDRLSGAEEALEQSMTLYKTEAEETEDERLAALEDDLRELHICIDDLFLTDQRKTVLPKAYRIS
ncbi:DUF5446 family protein [Bacillus sp. YC2]|uniref:DUF5446 family protein n=1 Tax=Bacillus sp. YC2 TaxID=2861287 RepID=UPI001CA63E01|nr:DUF5446 family protein [Bacillus sp. YC2]MBY8913725.1 DUF5446 family protein [Bacillus sp. YC2]